MSPLKSVPLPEVQQTKRRAWDSVHSLLMFRMTPVATSQSASLSADGVIRPITPSSISASRLINTRFEGASSKADVGILSRNEKKREERIDWRATAGTPRRMEDQRSLYPLFVGFEICERMGGIEEWKKDGWDREVGGRGGKIPILTNLLMR